MPPPERGCTAFGFGFRDPSVKSALYCYTVVLNTAAGDPKSDNELEPSEAPDAHRLEQRNLLAYQPVSSFNTC